MKMKRTKKHIVVQFTESEFDALWAALDSVNQIGRDSGQPRHAYSDVEQLAKKILSCLVRLQNRIDNVWVGVR